MVYVFTLAVYVKYKGDFFCECLEQRGGAFVSALSLCLLLCFTLTSAHIHSNITQPPLMYLCWYFVNNKRRQNKKMDSGFLSNVTPVPKHS